MNTTLVGDWLERRIYDLLRSEIDADKFWAKKANCKLFHKKGYYSKDRGSDIIIDVSVEIYLPGATEYSLVVFVECKNYSSPIPVSDAEEFFSKVQQISGANVKAVIASTASFQSGTKYFAKSKAIGLLRYFDKSAFHWELMRSPSATARVTVSESFVEDGLSREDFESTAFDLYFQSPIRVTNSLWDFFEDLAFDVGLTSDDVRKIGNQRSRITSQVPFLERGDIEERSAGTLAEIGYVRGEVSLDAICKKESERCGLKVISNLVAPEGSSYDLVLARIVFQPLEIHIFKQDEMLRGRERFTLAHELAHHLLNHSLYMSREYCSVTDLDSNRRSGIAGTDISRMEFQANYFAACLLMPRSDFVKDFKQFVGFLGLADKGFGAMYVDNQSCNLQSFEFVAGHLMQKYGVSKSAATIRLEGLGLLTDARGKKGLLPIQEVLLQSTKAGDE